MLAGLTCLLREPLRKKSLRLCIAVNRERSSRVELINPREAKSMAFTEITILQVDYAHVQDCSENAAIIPYILSNLPPGEWKNYFEKQAPASASVKIVGNIAYYKRQKDKAAIRKHGPCWNAVADLVEDANRYYLGVELRRQKSSVDKLKGNIKRNKHRPNLRSSGILYESRLNSVRFISLCCSLFTSPSVGL